MECLIIILVVSMIYFIFPSSKKEDQWDGSDIDGGTYGVADLNYNSPSFPYDEIVKKKTNKRTKKKIIKDDEKKKIIKDDEKKKVLPKKVKKKTKRKTKKK